MNTEGFPWWWVLVASIIITDVLAFWLGYYWHQYRSSKNKKPAVNAEVLKQQIDVFDSALQGIDSSLSSVDEAMELMRDAEQAAGNDPDQKLHDQAIRIAERMAGEGASKAELVRTCGLTPGEAAMIHRMHKPSEAG